jgi:hypothetical protein
VEQILQFNFQSTTGKTRSRAGKFARRREKLTTAKKSKGWSG